MFDIPLERLMDKEDLDKVTVRDGQIPLFGDKTEEICRTWLRWFDHYRSGCSPGFHYRSNFDLEENLQLALKSVLVRTQMGAIAKKLNLGQGKALELYAGIGIPAVAYNLLSNHPAMAVDINSTFVDEGKQLFEGVDYCPANVQEFLPKAEVGENEVLLVAYGTEIRKTLDFMFEHKLKGGVFLDQFYNFHRLGYKPWMNAQGYSVLFSDIDVNSTIMSVKRR